MLEYAPIAELLGVYPLANAAMNCTSAPVPPRASHGRAQRLAPHPPPSCAQSYLVLASCHSVYTRTGLFRSTQCVPTHQTRPPCMVWTHSGTRAPCIDCPCMYRPPHGSGRLGARHRQHVNPNPNPTPPTHTHTHIPPHGNGNGNGDGRLGARYRQHVNPNPNTPTPHTHTYPLMVMVMAMAMAGSAPDTGNMEVLAKFGTPPLTYAISKNSSPFLFVR